MKRQFIAALLLVVLSGCGGGGDDASTAPTAPLSSAASTENHGYGWAYDAQSRHGLKLRRAGATFRNAEDFEARAATIAIVCLDYDDNALPPPPPFVIATHQGTLPDPFDGMYFSGPPLIVFEQDTLFEHEVIHFLLELRTGDPDKTHSAPVWLRCSGGV